MKGVVRMLPVVTVTVGLIGLIIGWHVTGYQKITEKLTDERRSAYLELLHAADEANITGGANQAELERTGVRAEFVCSRQMLKSGRINKLVRAVNAKAWSDERELFLLVARCEGLNNYLLGSLPQATILWSDYCFR